MAEHAWAGVDMRGHAWAHTRTKEDVRCGVPAQQRRTRLRQAWAAEPACRRPVYTHNNDASFSSGGRRWSMRMGTRRRHTLICVLISLSTGSARSLQAGERLGERLHRVHQPRSPVRHLLMISWHYIVAHRRMWPGEGETLKPRATRSCALESTSRRGSCHSCRLVFALRRCLCIEFNLFLRSRVCSSEPGAVVHPWRVLWRPYMHLAKLKLRLLAAL